MKTVTYTIESRGRKWYKAFVPEKGYKANVEINEASKDWNVGSTYTFNAEVEIKIYRGMRTYYVFPVSEKELAEREARENLREYKRWLGYVAEKAEEGYIYRKGIEKMREFNPCQETEDKIKELMQKARRTNAYIRGREYLGFIRNNLNDYWYKKGESVVLECIQEASPEDARLLQDRLNELKAEYAKKEEQAEARKSAEKAAAPWHVYRGSGYGGHPYRVGQVFRSPKYILEKDGPEFLCVTRTHEEYIREDGMSFGVGDENGYIYSADCRAATGEEIAVILERERLDAEYRAAEKELNNLKQYIRDTGERPDGRQAVKGEVFFDTSTIYGGGSWFVVQDDYVWFIQNNGADGDDWSLNNITTGGAGAIGWRIAYQPEIAEKLRQLTKTLK